MAIERLSFTQFRNLANTQITLHSKLNFFYGLNGSGKTSLLEAIYFIATGRSFKSRAIETIIKRNSESTEFVLFGQISDHLRRHQVGIKKSTIQATQIRVNKESIRSASQLAKLSPTILIDPLSFELLNGAPGQRRQFLDWGVFHVEHLFSLHWNNYINCLKQRNNLLRNAKIDQISLSIWDAKLAELGEAVHLERLAYFDKFQVQLSGFLKYFALDENIKVSYFKGWDKSKSLDEALGYFRDKDIERRFTQAGPHRADIKVTLFGHAARENLSRGQQKLFIIALFLAQMQTLYDVHQKKTVVLIDDVTAELDEENLKRVFSKLLALEAQVIVTILNDSVLKQLSHDQDAYKMFHVEHGQIKELE